MTRIIRAADVVEKIGRIVGRKPLRFGAARGGWTVAKRWIVEFADGTRAFAKISVNEKTAAWLRAEHRIYSSLKAEFLPTMLGWHDDGDRPILVLEDLSDGFWPPPWNSERIERVRAVLSELWRMPHPAGLPGPTVLREGRRGWRDVASDPRPFLALKLCTESWLKAALPRLIAAESEARIDGDDLLHGDVKSDNICFHGEQCLLIDWNWACRGNGLVDLASWLPSLQEEGGPAPEAILPGQAPLAALLSGYLAYHAAQPPPPQVPVVREKQLMRLKRALPWACRELKLPAPDLLSL